MELIFKKRLNTKKNSIFYSLINHKNNIIGFGRLLFQGKKDLIQEIKLDKDFNIIEEDSNNVYIGEDPRCFIHNKRLYILDNYCNDMYLIDYQTKQYLKLKIGGKNPSFISHKNNLYLIHYIKPFELYKLDINTGNVIKQEVDDDKQTLNYEYRGGTPAYKINKNEYYGFGHRTYYDENSILKHDIFKWVVSFKNAKPSIKIIEVKQPINSNNICDPTSVIEIDNHKYLITAESKEAWFHEQDYITNVYEIKEDNFFVNKYILKNEIYSSFHHNTPKSEISNENNLFAPMSIS